MVTALARVDSRTKRLTGRLRPGEIAVIDHAELDRVAAEALVNKQVQAVLNAAAASSERFANLGPQLLIEHGVVLIDQLGPDIMTITEGDHIRLDLSSGQVFDCNDQLIAAGTVQNAASVAAAMERARAVLPTALTAFAENTLSFIRQEGEWFFDLPDISNIKTPMADTPVLIVVRGYDYQADLAVLRPFVRECHPIIVGVDGGADAVLEAGLKPHLIVGDMDSISDTALTCGAELVVHAYRDGQAPGAQRLKALGLPHTCLAIAGTSEDAAMMIADEKQASLIVAVGSHRTLVEFLDKGRAGMASTFLTRLRVGGKLVDAQGVSRLYRSRISNWQLAGLGLGGAVALLAALSVTPGGRAALSLLIARFDDVVAFVGGLF
jgi:uncharacterized membrane-anchored protein